MKLAKLDQGLPADPFALAVQQERSFGESRTSGVFFCFVLSFIFLYMTTFLYCIMFADVSCWMCETFYAKIICSSFPGTDKALSFYWTVCFLSGQNRILYFAISDCRFQCGLWWTSYFFSFSSINIKIFIVFSLILLQ